MASTNQTTNYGLPIYSAGDRASWVDTNQAFGEIDAAVHNAVETAQNAAEDVAGAVSTANESKELALTASAGVETLGTTKQNATDNNLSTTDKTVTGAINELNANLSDISGMLNTFKVVASGYSGRELPNFIASYPEHSMFILVAKRHADNSHGCCYLITKFENDSTPYIYTISNSGFELITNSSGTLWLVYGSTSDANRYSYDFSLIQVR